MAHLSAARVPSRRDHCAGAWSPDRACAPMRLPLPSIGDAESVDNENIDESRPSGSLVRRSGGAIRVVCLARLRHTACREQSPRRDAPSPHGGLGSEARRGL